MPLTAWHHDLRFAVRTFLESAPTTIVAVLVLATGISAHSALFTILNSVVLRPLQFLNPDRLVMIWDTQPRVSTAPAAPGHLTEWQANTTRFAGMAGIANARVALTGRDEPEQIASASVTANFFEVLGIAPRLGRTFLSGEDSPGRNRVVMISSRLWRLRFGADPHIVGQTVDLDRISHTVVGILPESFRWPRRPTDLWIPLALDPALAQNHALHFLQVVARLNAGITLAQAQTELSTIAARISHRIPAATGHGVKVEPLLERAMGDTRPVLVVLLAATGFILLISCANVANLLLVKATARRQEIAVRAALGASRSRILRQLLTESLLLAGLAGALGFGLSLVWVRLLTRIAPAGTPRLEEISVDLRVVGFTLCATVAAALLFGLAPGVQACRTDIHATLQAGGKSGTPDASRCRARNFLIVAETALALVLSIGAGLAGRSLLAIEGASPGFAPDRVLSMRIQLPPSGYAEPTSQRLFFDRWLAAVNALPGVQAAGLINDLPLSGSGIRGGFVIQDRPAWPRGQQPLTEFRVASAGYLHSMGIPVKRGRGFGPEDSAGRPPIVILSETIARRYWPNQDPLGQHLRLRWTESEPWRTIVGIASDVKSEGLYADPTPDSYIPYSQHPVSAMTLTVRYSGDAAALILAIRAQVRGLDRNLPVSAIEPLERIVAESIAPRTCSTALLAGFAGIALWLAAAGIYGVVASIVSQRSREIGIRIALGATRWGVVRQVAAEHVRWILAGLGLGIAAAALLARLAAGLLYGVPPLDAMAFTAAPLLLFAVGLAACLVPAGRAAHIDPMATLRQ